MSLEAPKNTPGFERPTERLLLGVRRLHELADTRTAIVSVDALRAADAVIGRLRPDFQEALINLTAGAVSGLGIPVTSGSQSEARSVLDALIGISATTTKLKRRAEK